MKTMTSLENMHDTDKKILVILQEEGRATLSRISEILNKKFGIKLKENAIRARMKKMEKQPIIEKYMAVVNCKQIGYKEMLMASLRLTAPVKEVGAKLREIDEIKYIYITSGEYPLFVMAKCFGHQESLKIVEQLQKIEGVEEVKTEIVLDCIKEDHTIHILDS
jgi:DNA-binding Lrp family transcriptional regulator